MDKKHKIREFTKDDVTVVWDSSKCSHSKKCWKELGSVFKPMERPWIKMDGATAEEIKAQVSKCPSGALSCKSSSDSVETEVHTPDNTFVKVIPGGPLQVLNSCVITHADGSEEIRENRASFCRCGASENKPFCDGNHRNIEWEG